MVLMAVFDEEKDIPSLAFVKPFLLEMLNYVRDKRTGSDSKLQTGEVVHALHDIECLTRFGYEAQGDFVI